MNQLNKVTILRDYYGICLSRAIKYLFVIGVAQTD